MTSVARDPKESIESTLPGLTLDAYGPEYRAHSLEFYKVYLEMANRISTRREKANSFFLTVNAALLALIVRDAEGASDARYFIAGAILPTAASVLCYLWYRTERSYRDINSAKFRVVQAIERQLPLRPYDAEWEAVGRGENATLYLPFSHVELVVPWVFVAFYVIILGGTVSWSSFF